MIKRADLNPYGYIVTPEISLNLNTLEDKLNVLIQAGCPIERFTSALRSEADQKRINPAAMKSKHLIGAAVDVADPNGYVLNWVLNNWRKLEAAGLYIECPSHTPGWLHLQIFAPKSGNRSFIP